MLFVDYHTGAGDQTADTLENAIRIADDGACYTQSKITISDENGIILAERIWYECKVNPDEIEDFDEIIDYGDFGYYGPWVIY